MLRAISENRICAFCKLDHRVYPQKEVSFFDLLLLLGVAGLMAVAIWGGPDLRSLLIFISLAFILQVFIRVRYRASVKCPHCGFDPILYKQDQERAAQKVKAFLEKRKNNPGFMLKPQPQISPIYKTRDEIKAEEKARRALQSTEPGASEVIPSSDRSPSLIDTTI